MTARLFFALCAMASTLAAADFSQWAEFRGPTGQGIAKGPAPTKWGVDEGVAWSVEVAAEGWSSPLVVEQSVVLTGAKKDGDEIVLAVLSFDRESGDVQWERELFRPSEEELMAKQAKNSLASATPVISEGIIYAHFGHMGTAALKLADGEVVWKKHLKYPPMHGNGSSPVIVDDLLVLNVDAEENPRVVALRKADGSVAWETARNQDVRRTFSFCTPLVIGEGADKQIISPGSGMVGAYSPADGKLLWKARYGEGFSVVPRPVTDGKLLFVASGFMKPKLLAIDPANARGDVTDSKVVWEKPRHIPKTPSFVHSEGYLYILDDTGMLSCVEAATGDEEWKEKLIGNFSASLTLADDDILYALTEDGELYVLEVAPNGHKVLSEINMKDRLFASPALVEGELFLRSEGKLWKITGV